MEQFACPKCLKVLVWEASQAGHPHVCPSCEAVIAVPEKPGIPRARAVEAQPTSSFGRWQSYADPLPFDPGPPITLHPGATSKKEAWRTVRLGLGWCFGGTIVGSSVALLALALQGHAAGELLIGGGLFYAFLYGIGLCTTMWAPEEWIGFLARVAFIGFISNLAAPFCCVLGQFDTIGAVVGLCAALSVWLLGFNLFLWSIVIHFRDRELWNEPKYLVLYQAVVIGVAGYIASGWPTIETRTQGIVLAVMQLVAFAWQLRLIRKVREVIASHVR